MGNGKEDTRWRRGGGIILNEERQPSFFQKEKKVYQFTSQVKNHKTRRTFEHAPLVVSKE